MRGLKERAWLLEKIFRVKPLIDFDLSYFSMNLLFLNIINLKFRFLKNMFQYLVLIVCSVSLFFIFYFYEYHVLDINNLKLEFLNVSFE